MDYEIFVDDLWKEEEELDAVNMLWFGLLYWMNMLWFGLLYWRSASHNTRDYCIEGMHLTIH